MSKLEYLFKISADESKHIKIELGWKTIVVDPDSSNESNKDGGILQSISKKGRSNSLPDPESPVQEWQTYLDTNETVQTRASSVGNVDEAHGLVKEPPQEQTNSNGGLPKGRGLLGSSRREYLRQSGKFTLDDDETKMVSFNITIWLL